MGTNSIFLDKKARGAIRVARTFRASVTNAESLSVGIFPAKRTRFRLVRVMQMTTVVTVAPGVITVEKRNSQIGAATTGHILMDYTASTTANVGQHWPNVQTGTNASDFTDGEGLWFYGDQDDSLEVRLSGNTTGTSIVVVEILEEDCDEHDQTKIGFEAAPVQALPVTAA